ncbi:MAG: glycosyltransferase family 4 protein [Dehalococcoidia bacterium]
MRILTTLTYYSPHVSGLTIYARRLIRRLVRRGHDVTVLTSRFRHDLPAVEMIDGATVRRSPVLARLSKGVLMPLFPWQAARLIPRHDLVYLHLPQMEASCVAAAAKVWRKPIVATYHCDIELPPGLARFATTPAIRVSHYLAGKLADRIVVNTQEFGEAARLPRHFNRKVSAIYPPIELSPVVHRDSTFRERYDLGSGPLVGFVGRLAEEKGIDYLLASVETVAKQVPGVRYVLVGMTDQIPGERVHERALPMMEAMHPTVTHLGVLPDDELTEFYQTLDVLVLPSVNSTESFGMTQAEAMLAGTPVVTSDLPGVREAVRISGMGELVPPRDRQALAQGIVKVLKHPHLYAGSTSPQQLFDPDRTTDLYEELFTSLLAGGSQLSATAPDSIGRPLDPSEPTPRRRP